ncbi:MAG: hemerythrin family protein [Desulfobacterales bacterium]|nr:hemerythrin family protein [Desulfobacterales bacterium]
MPYHRLSFGVHAVVIAGSKRYVSEWDSPNGRFPMVEGLFGPVGNMEDTMQWNKSYSIGIQKIDDQHKRLMQLISRLEDVITTERVSKTMGDALKAIVDYTNYHFNDEEDLMVQIKYSERLQHKEMHETLIAEVRKILLDLRGGKPLSVVDLIGFLKHWVIDHIEKEDKKIGLEMEKLRESMIDPNEKMPELKKSPPHELKGNLQKLSSFADRDLITKEEFAGKKAELLDKFVRKFSPGNVFAVIEEFKAFHLLHEGGLIDEDDVKRIVPELSNKIDLSVLLPKEETLEDALAHLNRLFETNIISKEIYSTLKKELLNQI